jgi:hypothetical protein
MKIETYEIEEVNNSEASTLAADGAAMEIIEKLGLKGQQELMNPETGTRFQYPRLTKLQRLVYLTNFPEITEISQFKHEIIPIRVLQVAAFCRDFPQTQYLEVWHSAIPRQDPILIGKKERWSSEEYLLARWGESLLSFQELVEKAKPILQAKYKSKMAKLRAKLGEMESEIVDAANEALLTGDEPSFTIYS